MRASRKGRICELEVNRVAGERPPREADIVRLQYRVHGTHTDSSRHIYVNADAEDVGRRTGIRSGDEAWMASDANAVLGLLGLKGAYKRCAVRIGIGTRVAHELLGVVIDIKKMGLVGKRTID